MWHHASMPILKQIKVSSQCRVIKILKLKCRMKNNSSRATSILIKMELKILLIIPLVLMTIWKNVGTRQMMNAKACTTKCA